PRRTAPARHYSRERLAEIRVLPRSDGGHDFELHEPDLPGPSAVVADAGAPLLEARDIRKTFHRGGEPLHAVRGVGFELRRGETLGLVGQPGSGQPTLGQILPRPV